MPTAVTIDRLIQDYDTLLLDAYGVLVDATGPLAGAADLIARLRSLGKPFFVVTNDASRLPSTCAARFARYGLTIADDEIITSGSLLADYFERRGLHGAPCAVLGPADSMTYVREAGGVIVELSPEAPIRALVVCDDSGYPFLETCDAALSAVFRHFDRGDAVDLVLPNPDLIYPKTPGAFGFTAGAVALLIEAALERRYPNRGARFDRLGKPGAALFEAARRRAGGGRLVMIGDQLETDIAGARAAGIDAALLSAGVSQWNDSVPAASAPTYLLDGITPGSSTP